MTRIAYITKRFTANSLAIIERANTIVEEYAAQGFSLTLRQLYYQFVARDLIPNTQRDYKRLGAIVNNARLAGALDWEAIEDRTRTVRELEHWEDPADIIGDTTRWYRRDRWADQPARPEVWIEKDALLGVFEGVCQRFDVPLVSCRGYTSQSEMWRAGLRLGAHRKAGQAPVVFHFGDHDPSGQDMSRDIRDRLELFGYGGMLQRLALNMDQVEEFGPPPNPAKVTDSRYEGYLLEYGSESWELDALEPAVLAGLVEEYLREVMDEEAWEATVDTEEEERAVLSQMSERFCEVSDFLADTE